jgi:hypothetical protein
VREMVLLEIIAGMLIIAGIGYGVLRLIATN